MKPAEILKTVPRVSLETQQIFRRLETCAVGEVVTYEELNRVIGGDVTQNKRYALETAKRQLRRDKNMVFETVRKLGVKRLPDSEIVQNAKSDTQRIHRISRRGLQKLNCVEAESLSAQELVQYNARVGHLGALFQATKLSQAKRIETAVEVMHGRLQLGQTLDLFKSE